MREIAPRPRSAARSAGTGEAITEVMAAVLALFMVPLAFALLLFGSVTENEHSVASAVAMLTLVGLGAGVLGGLLRFIRGAEGPEDTHAR